LKESELKRKGNVMGLLWQMLSAAAPLPVANVSVQTSPDTAAVTQASLAAARSQRTAEDLASRVDRLTLACVAMWELLREQTQLTDEQLLEKVREVDLRDGQLDGKISNKQLRRCQQCDRVMSPRHARCIYCGADNPTFCAFDGAM
jgi:hypothetical protein